MAMDIGGAETHILELSRELKKRGVNVTIASNGGAYETELEKCGIPHVKIPCHSKNPVFMNKAYKMLRSLILKEKFDVVHAHARIPAFLCGKLHRKYGFRFVTTAHGVFNPGFPYNLLTDWGDKSLAVSVDIKEYLIKNYGISPENIKVTINGIDLEKFSPSTNYSDIEDEFALTRGVPRIVHVSRLDADPGFIAHTLIDIAPALAEEFKGIEIVIVGGGDDYTGIAARADEINKKLGRRAVIMTGARTDINKFAASGDLFVGVSRAALEAMGCESPVILAGKQGYIGTFDENVLPVSIETNFCCRGCGDTTAEALLRDIKSTLALPAEEKARLGKYGRETVRQHYSLETMASDALKLYISVIKQSPLNEVDDAEFDSIDKYLKYNPISPKNKKYDVLISGYYGFGNMGDDCILETITGKLRESAPEIRIAALTKHPDVDSKHFGICCVKRMNLFKIARVMKSSRVLISGGGSLFQDSTSSKSLKYYAFIINMARFFGMKTYVYANGIGTINFERNKRLTAKTLKHVDRITVRDRSSYDELISLGLSESLISLTADPAFLMTPCSDDEVRAAREKHKLDCAGKYFAVSLRRFEGLQKYAYNEADLLDSILESCAHIAKTYGLTPVFVSMQSYLDLDVSRVARDGMRDKYGINALAISPESGRELLSILRGSDELPGAEFVCAMRLHILIYACSAAVPMIGLSLDPKINAFMEALLPENLVEIPELSPDLLKETMSQTVKNRESLVALLKEKSDGFKKQASGDVNTVFELLK